MLSTTLLAQRLTDALTAAWSTGTVRDVRLPTLPSMAVAVVGIRRSGKTTLLQQVLAQRERDGVPRSDLLFLSLEDDRLTGISTADLDWWVEEWARRSPGVRGGRNAVLVLDEIQLIPEWDRFVRRLLDQEPFRILLSGSSAHLLGSEIATAMRGRALTVSVYPFSFREALRHRGEEPDAPWPTLSRARRTALDAALRAYLVEGGFPGVQGLSARDRHALLSSYVDVVVLRDVIERHRVSNVVALRSLERHLLARAGSQVSLQKCYDSMRSQGLAVTKDALHAWARYFEETFLIVPLWLHSDSERRRMIHPRKMYPIDPALIPLFVQSAEPQTGHALETVILLELLRRGGRVSYGLTRDGYEIDFVVEQPGEPMQLIQVATALDDAAVREREVRALLQELEHVPDAQAMLLTMDLQPPDVPPPIRWQSATEWLLTTTAAHQ